MTNETFDEALTERLEILLVYATPGLLFDPVGEQVANRQRQVATGIVVTEMLVQLWFGFDLQPATHREFCGRFGGVKVMLNNFDFLPQDRIDCRPE